MKMKDIKQGAVVDSLNLPCQNKDYLKIIFVFIDGFGIGEEDTDKNPFCRAYTPALDFLIKKYGYFKADACLGVSGLPQSATGQTALYTGINAPKILGRHCSARPTRELRELIMKDNIFISLKKKGYKPTFANVYTKEYLERMQKNPRGIFKPSVTTLMCMSASIRFRVLDDYLADRGIFHDINGRKLIERGYNVELITPEKAAENLYNISREYDFTLFEFFMSDIAGHSMDMQKSVYELELLDKMLYALLKKIDLDKEFLIIASDHGNIEDITISTHTKNPVPIIFAGKYPEGYKPKINSLTDVTPEILRLYEQNRKVRYSNTPVFKALTEYYKSSILSFHMPGHVLGRGLLDTFKENMPYFDITEVGGMDNLQHPEGIILEAERLASKAFGAKKTFFLVNGATSGIHAMILAHAGKGEKMICSRDCHKSAVSAMILGGIEPVFISPEIDLEKGLSLGPSAETVKDALNEHPDAKAVFITRPSYYGVCCNLEAIAEAVHEKGKVLLVDEAHGAHFRFHERLPKTALELGADVCVQSAHKTLPALTQCAYLHIGSDRADIEKVSFFLNLLRTSSPSYIFMASLDTARKVMQLDGRNLYERLFENIEYFSMLMEQLVRFGLVDFEMPGIEIDRTRLVIGDTAHGISGYKLEELLRRKYKIQVEMSDVHDIVCITTPFHTKEDFGRLFFALKEVEKEHGYFDGSKKFVLNRVFIKNPEKVLSIDKVLEYPRRIVPLENAAGKVSAEMIVPYPPGTVFLCPGEKFTKDIVGAIAKIIENGGEVLGVKDEYVAVI